MIGILAIQGNGCERSTMRILRAINKQICIAVFAFIFSTSIGYMMGTLHVIEIMEEKAKLVDNLNQAELELFEAERQLVHCDSELGKDLICSPLHLDCK